MGIRFPSQISGRRLEIFKDLYKGLGKNVHNATTTSRTDELLSRHNYSLEAMGVNISMEFEDLFPNVVSLPRKFSLLKRKVVNWLGVCYEFKLDYNTSKTSSQYASITLGLKDDVTWFGYEHIYNIYTGNIDFYGNQPPEVAAVNVARGFITRAAARVRKTLKYAGRSGDRCKDYTTSDRSYCLCKVGNRMSCQDSCKMPLLRSTNHPETPQKDVCNMNDHPLSCHVRILLLTKAEGLKIEDQCPQTCEENVFEMTITQVPSADTVLEYRMDVPGSSTLILEYPETTLADFMSNLGGTMGLWFGMSVVSLVQIGVILIFPRDFA